MQTVFPLSFSLGRRFAIARHLTYAVPIVSLCNINPFAGPNLSLLSTVDVESRL
jgi:hypothetical protein